MGIRILLSGFRLRFRGSGLVEGSTGRPTSSRGAGTGAFDSGWSASGGARTAFDCSWWTAGSGWGGICGPLRCWR